MAKFCCLSVLIFLVLAHCNSLEIHRKFEYKYSFKPPYLAQKDSTVPFWEYGGNAIASSENVRIAPSLRSQKGAIWTKSQTNFDWWEVDIVFRVSGRGRIGADGLAFWYSSEKGDYNGNVFGSSDKWTGLGVFFDSFDNDNKHNNPYISAVVNDGTKAFDHQQDGSTQLLAGCLRDFRNKPFPTRAKIEYYRNTLTVLFHGGMTNNDQDYEMCLRAENVFLPKNGYFGLSAATGGLADDHDVFHFLTTSLHPPGEIGGPGGHQLPAEDSQKLSQEYADYQSKLDKQKEDYRREHPEEKKADDLENWFESDNQRELRQIWQAQSATNEVLRDMTRKLDEIIGRQERTLGLLSAGGAVAHQPGVGAGAGGATSTIMRHEVDSLMGQQNVLVQTVKDIRGLVGDVYSRTDTILTNQGRGQGSAHVQPAGYDMQSVIAEMRDGMNQVKQGVAAVGQRLAQQVPPAAAQTGCPTKNCLGMTPFLITVTIQLVIILGYSIYRDNREAQAKKFY